MTKSDRSSADDFLYDGKSGLFLPKKESDSSKQSKYAELKQLMSDANFAEAEEVSGELLSSAPPYSAEYVMTAHIVARAKFANRKFEESQLYLNLATEIRKQQKKPIAVEDILLDILSAELLEENGSHDECLIALDKVIDICKRDDFVSYLKIPVMKKCLILVRRKELAAIKDLLLANLPLLTKYI